MKLSISKTQRLGVIEELPYATAIKDNELRELVYDAWAMSLSSSSFERINDMPCSGGPGTPELKGRGQAAHLNGVARIGVSIAQGLKEEVSHFAVDMDEVIAGGLLPEQIAHIAGTHSAEGRNIMITCATAPRPSSPRWTPGPAR